MFQLRLLLLTLLPCAAFSQSISLPKPGPARLDGSTICLTLPQAAKVRDSLNALPLVRREARSLRTAATNYRLSADSARASYYQEVQAGLNVRVALREQKIETVRYEVAAKQWKAKARKRGLLNWLAGALVAAITYATIIY